MNSKNNPGLISETNKRQEEKIQWSNQCTYRSHMSYVRDQMVHPKVEKETVFDTSIGSHSNQESTYSSDYIREKMVQW